MRKRYWVSGVSYFRFVYGNRHKPTIHAYHQTCDMVAVNWKQYQRIMGNRTN